MISIDDIIVSDDLKDKYFICDINACKGACCTEGDTGAPLEDEELKIIEDIFEKVKPYLTPKGIAVIESQGPYTFDEEDKVYGTSLIDGKACAFINYENGISVCGIEKAYNDKIIDFKKPISCHLYPIRASKLSEMVALNYDKWDICSAACSLGFKEKTPVYKFLKEPLIRKYGEGFYAALEYAFKEE